MEMYTPGEAYLTWKDHKIDFPHDPKLLKPKFCRTINPAKTDVGKLSQTILKEMVTELRDKLKLNQWKSTHEVLKWFGELKQMKTTRNQPLKFIKFDIESFYRNISRKLFEKAIEFFRACVFLS